MSIWEGLGRGNVINADERCFYIFCSGSEDELSSLPKGRRKLISEPLASTHVPAQTTNNKFQNEHVCYTSLPRPPQRR